MMRAGVTLMIRRTHASAEPLILAVTNRAFGGISLPGGKANEGEETRRAACRELKEETTVITIPADLTRLVRDVNIMRVQRAGEFVDEACLVKIYFARHAWGEPKDVEVKTKHSWVTFSELLAGSPFRPFYEKHFQDRLDHLRETIFAPAATAPSVERFEYECAECSAKSGSPPLCDACLKRRAHAGSRWLGPRP